MAAPRWKTTPCKACGAPLVWAEDDAGTRHPLDAKAPTFLAVPDARVGAQCKRMPDVLVSHFATCPGADTFSGKARKAKRGKTTVAGEVERGMQTEADAAAAFGACKDPETLAEWPSNLQSFTGPQLSGYLREWARSANTVAAQLMHRAAELLEQREGQRAGDEPHTAVAGAGGGPDGAAPRPSTPARDADPAAMLQEAAGMVNPEGTLCGLCDSTGEHVHPQLVCLRCGVVGLSENMRAHVCGERYGPPPTDDGMRLHEADAWEADARPSSAPSLAFVQVLERNGEGDLFRTCGQTYSHEHHRLACTACKATGLDVDMRGHRCDAPPAPASIPPEPTDPELW